MKCKLLVPVLILSLLLALLGGTANVGAVGPATDNTTILDIPADDHTGEIKPPVEYSLRAPSAQSENASPDFIPAFIGPSTEHNSMVTGRENWYLEVDINAPGWLYIYEHFPEGTVPPGRWLAYKWQLPQGGVWRLGPFSPGEDEPEGQHVYVIWFYSNGHWAGEDSEQPQGKLVYWTYARGESAEKPVEQQGPQTAPAPPGGKFTDRLRALLSSPLAALIGFSALLLFALALLGLYLYRRYTRRGEAPPPVRTKLEGMPSPAPAATPRGKIALPNGMEILLDGGGRVIGRGDLARALEIQELALVSRRHFEIKAQQGQFYIEDLGSANGTRLNGVDISGKGQLPLNHDDVIELAGVIRLKFHIL